MKTIRVISHTILISILMFVFASCSKENGDNFFRFNKEGGGKEFAVEYDGETISIKSKGDLPQNAYFVEDNANPDDSQWCKKQIYFPHFSEKRVSPLFGSLMGRLRV